MNKRDFVDLKKWFSSYVSGYYKNDPEYDRPVRLKEDHTKKVCRDIVMLGKELDLSDHDMVLAETMALFHDVGRFKQYAVYGTFNDRASENHARLGLGVMAKHSVLSVCTGEERRLISKAIACHNASSLPRDGDARQRFFMRLLRDADKLDVWRVLIDYYKEREERPSAALELNLPDNPTCSPEVLNALFEHRFALMQDAKTLNDVKLIQISWVFDLNFPPSIQTVKKRRYIEQLSAFLPQAEEVTEAIKQVQDYMDSPRWNPGGNSA